MSEGSFLENLPPEDKDRLAYIEGREDLFRTKVFEVEKETPVSPEEEVNIVVASRDPGSANALWPVVELLQKQEDTSIKVVADGRAQEIFAGKFKIKDITPSGNILQTAEVVGSPDVILTDAAEEQGIEMFFAATFPEVPVVLVEDYYSTSLDHLKRLKEAKMPYPKKICVMDKIAGDILTKNFPEVADSIEVTGQPTFDRFAHENTEKIARDTREKLGIKPEEKLITFMSALDGLELSKRMAKELAKVDKDFKFTFRIHPRDNTPFKDHEQEFVQMGVDCVQTMSLPTSEVGAASDLVITTNSIEGLHAIYRKKPTIYITDRRFNKEDNEDMIPPPPVKLGAGIGVDKIEDLADWVETLLDPQRKESKALRKNMDKNYRADGRNASRVVKVLNEAID